MADLPCDADGMCMVCKVVPPDEDVLLCSSCTSPWHMRCLNPPLTAVPPGDWECPDCNMPPAPPTSSTHAAPAVPAAAASTASTGLESDMVAQIHAIQADKSLTDAEKARKRQELMANQSVPAQNGKVEVDTQSNKQPPKGRRNETMEMLDQNLNCIFCMNLAERPVTTPCGHNFCLKCFQRWIGQGKKSCGKCRAPIPAAMANQPRINAALVMAIRLAKAAANSGGTQGPPKQYHSIDNEKRPDKCFTSERAVKTGKANACSGRIFVTIPPDHFGPILSEYDPVRGQGVLVGESWEDRMECRQWGAHFPHVAGIAGQSDYGAQSVALSGGYEDDEDHGEWFLYTGSGGRDLSGNKRTNKEQSFDQKFDKSNEALRVSCKLGYPVRVVRSHKEKRSSYAPEKGVRYDGVYRIEKCWRKKGVQGHMVCRYLFVRCDNEPAPWTSDEVGDRKRALPQIGELKEATNVFERKSGPSWDWKEDSKTWGWTKDPPESRKTVGGPNGEKSSRRKHLNIQQKLLKEFGCFLCRRVMQLPLSTPCGHNFCKSCLVGVFSGQQDMRERKGVGGRSLRVQKVMKRCPTCNGDITDFITCPQVNRQMEDLIQSLKSSIAEDADVEDVKGETDIAEKDSEDKDDGRDEMVKDTDDESDGPAVPHSEVFPKPTENGHSNPIENGHGNVLASANGQSNGMITSENLARSVGDGQVTSVEDRKDKSTTEHVTELEVDFLARVATNVPKKRGRPPKVVKRSDDKASDADGEVSAKRSSGEPRKEASKNLDEVSDSAAEVAINVPKKVATPAKVVQHLDDESSDSESEVPVKRTRGRLRKGAAKHLEEVSDSDSDSEFEVPAKRTREGRLRKGAAKDLKEVSDSDTDNELEVPTKRNTARPKNGSRQNGRTHEVVSDLNEESTENVKKSAVGSRNGRGSPTVVLESDDGVEEVYTPSRRYTRSQHATAISSLRNPKKSLGRSLADVIVL